MAAEEPNPSRSACVREYTHLRSTPACRYPAAVPPLPRLTGAELVRSLQRLPSAMVVQRGSHVQLRHPERGGRVTVPVHAGKVLGPGLVQAILKQAGIGIDDLREVL